MDGRGIYMSSDLPTAKKFADGLLKFNEQILQIVNVWERSVRPKHAARFKPFVVRIRQFSEFRNKDLEMLGALYAKQALETYATIDAGIDFTAWLMSVLGVLAILLAAVGALILRRAVVRPLAEITRVT